MEIVTVQSAERLREVSAAGEGYERKADGIPWCSIVFPEGNAVECQGILFFYTFCGSFEAIKGFVNKCITVRVISLGVSGHPLWHQSITRISRLQEVK